jgi:phosphatidylglycerol:prolipoprotein diacylglycerol transferase
MLQTLFYIPAEVRGVPLFGFGVLLWLWLAWCVVYAVLAGKRAGWNSELLGTLGTMVLFGGAIAFVAPRIMEQDASGHPLGIAIRGYGVMLLIGIVSGVALCVRRGREVGIAPDLILSFSLWLFITGMIGARLFYVIEYWQRDFQRATFGETIGAVLNLTRGGLVVFGAFIGALPAIVFFAVKHRLPILKLADVVAPCMTLGLAFGRVGCFFNGCCFGDQCELPWAVEFPAGSPPHYRQVEQGKAFGFQLSSPPGDAAKTIVQSVEPDSPAARAGLQAGDTLRSVDDRPVAGIATAREALVAAVHEGELPVRIETDRGARLVDLKPELAVHSLPVHPVQVYAAIDGLLTTLLLLAFDRVKRHTGETFALLLCVHAVSRFLLEIIRIDEPSVFGTGLSISQNISVAMLATGVALWIYLERRPAEAKPRQAAVAR